MRGGGGIQIALGSDCGGQPGRGNNLSLGHLRSSEGTRETLDRPDPS